MDKKEIKARADYMMEGGMPKAEVFGHLANRGLKDRQLAYHLAAWAPAERLAAHRGKVKVLIGVMALQALMVFLVIFTLGIQSLTARWLVAGAIALIPLLFAWGFHRNWAGTYNACILLSIIQFPRQFDGFSETPISSSLAALVSLGILGFVAYVRHKLFPDFVWMSPRKVKGKFVFAS